MKRQALLAAWIPAAAVNVYLVAVVVSTLAAPASATDATARVQLPCPDESARDCTAAMGRIDAERSAVRNKLGFYVFGGPALPQEPLEIIHDEYTKAGIEVWWTGDIPSARDAYYNAFNKRMEEAIDARRGQDYVRKVHDRIDARIRAARARDKARAVAGGQR